MYNPEDFFKKYSFINGSTLKIIACIAMFIDHLTYALWTKYRLYLTGFDYNTMQSYKHLYDFLRGIGRLAFPIFCFLLVEGFFNTKNIKKYLLRLGCFAIISEIPYDLVHSGIAFDFTSQNTFFTLLVSLLTIFIINKIQLSNSISINMSTLFTMLITTVSCLITYGIHSDYSYKGVLSIVLMYMVYFYSKTFEAIVGAISFFWEPAACIAFIPILFYNKKRGFKAKYIFYSIYPLHLLLIYIITTYVCPQLP